MQGASGKRLGQILVEQDWIKENDLLPVLAQLLQVPYVKLNAQLYDPAVLEIIRKEKAIQLCVFPLFKVRDVLLIATPSPLSIPVNDEIEDRTGCKIKAILASRKDVIKTIGEAYSEIKTILAWTCLMQSKTILKFSKMSSRMIIRILMKWQKAVRSLIWSIP